MADASPLERHPFSLFDLGGRVAIVTGGSRGIGLEIARGFAAAGASVVVAARDSARCDAVAGELREAGGSAVGVAFDLAEPETHAGVIEAAMRHFGRLDVLVNNGAILKPHFIEKVTAEELELVQRTNVHGPVLALACGVPASRGEREGGDRESGCGRGTPPDEGPRRLRGLEGGADQLDAG